MGVIIQYKSNDSSHLVWEISESINDLKDLSTKLQYNFSILETFKSEERQKQWLAVRLLCEKLSPGDLIKYKSNGQPQIAKSKISISHSHSLVAVSVNQQTDTGIDIQVLDPKILRIQDKFLSESEAKWAYNDLNKVTTIWSIKEAMYKLYGDGSPYFKEDYEVRKKDGHYSCSMVYRNKTIVRHVHLRTYNNFVIALVND